MRIEQRTPVAQGAAAKPRTGAGPKFTPDSAGASRAAAPTHAGGLIGLDAVLALQTDPEAGRERRRRAMRRGHELLDTLEALKIGLLSGRVSAKDLSRLSRQTQEAASSSGDPAIDGLLAHIELRAQVELAKLAPRQRSGEES
ncbi:MAG: flagellar assembly protein FliX [Beijerinckiaceae bacterium]